MSQARWETTLPDATEQYLSEMLEIGEAVPASARPAVITALPPAAKLPTSAERIAASVQGQIGLVAVNVDERPHPLWLRAGTSDAAAAVKSLAKPAGGFKIPFAPRRILEIGAGLGFRSIALALEYPGAEILTTEPDSSLQRAALLNTMPYRNISAAFVVLSTDNARYGFTGRKGEAGFLALARDDAGPMAAVQLKNFLYSRSWNVLDTVVITLDAANDHLMRTSWPATIRLIAVETGGTPLHEATAARFPDDKFLTIIEGDYVLLHRREPDLTPPPPRLTPIFNPEGTLKRVTLEHVAAQPPGFFTLGAYGFRLHPNATDSPPARLVYTQICRNDTELHLTLRVALAISAPVRFSIRITGGDEVILDASEILKGGETRSMIMRLAPYEGECEVMFQTEMADFESSNAGAWAEVTAASFV